MPTRLWYLTRYHFASLIDESADASHLRRFPARSPLFGDQDMGEQALLIKRGHVRVRMALPRLGTQTVEVVNPGEVIGVVDSAIEAPTQETAEAMDETEAYALTRDELADRANRNPLPPSTATARALMRIHRVEVKVDQMLFQPLETRLARVLRMLAGSCATAPDAGGRTITMRLPAWQLADLVESNRELVRLVLDHWVQRGIISSRSGRITLVQADEIDRLAQEA